MFSEFKLRINNFVLKKTQQEQILYTAVQNFKYSMFYCTIIVNAKFMYIKQLLNESFEILMKGYKHF